MKPFIVFEGLDGAGKTTLSKMLAADLNAIHVSTPPQVLIGANLRDVIDEEASLVTRFLYYMFGNALVSDQVRQLRKDRIVVCDRYVHSTLSIHQLLGLDLAIDWEALGFEKPDVSFFIFTSDEEERLRRILARGKNTKYDKMKEDPVFRSAYVNYFLKRDFIPVDTSNETPEQSLSKIRKKLAEIAIV